MMSMDDSEIRTLEQVEAVVRGARGIAFTIRGRKARYAWIEKTLKRFDYFKLKRRQKGLLKAYLGRLSGLSRPQITRLIKRYLLDGAIRLSRAPRRRFPVKYTSADKALLAETDNAHGRLSGPATQKVLQRQYSVYGDRRFVRLSGISSAHIYRLRQSRVYRENSLTVAKTRSVNVAIGIRRKPDPRGKPGYLRVDTVHQGDRDGVKGVYHVNMVDEVTQWEIVACVEAIAEAHLWPSLETALACFPFEILNFHSDNGGEFINGSVAKMLNKLLAEQTKSRSGRTNDNALVEGKNGSVIRKHMGYWHIERRFAPLIDTFYREHFNDYLNFHRPCAFATIEIDEKGRRKKTYETYQTPYERLKSFKGAAKYLREGVTLKALDTFAAGRSDNDAAARMQAARDALFKRLVRLGASTLTLAPSARRRA